MIGVPLLTGFISKYLFVQAGFEGGGKMIFAILALAISTLLNVIYFGRMIIILYTPVELDMRKPQGKIPSKIENAGAFGLALLNVALGCASYPVVQAIMQGLAMFD